MRSRKLENILEEAKIIGISVGVMAIFGSTYLGLTIYDNRIQENLEPCAISCGLKNNLIGFPDWKGTLPKIKNKDLDGNGKYESVIVYVKDGKKFYQEIRKTNEGLMLTEPRPYE